MAEGDQTEPFPRRNYFSIAALQPIEWRQFASWFSFLEWNVLPDGVRFRFPYEAENDYVRPL